MSLHITHISAATLLLEIRSPHLLTDPVFDPAGRRYSFGWGAGYTKLTAAPVSTESLGPIDAVLQRFPVSVGIFHLGRASFPVTSPIRFTMDARDGVKTARALKPRTIIPIHYEGWKHFRERRSILEKSFSAAGLSERVRWLELRQPTDVEI